MTGVVFKWSFGEAARGDVPAIPSEGNLLGGRYRIEGELGRGGMGVVFRGRDLELNRPVAIKLLSNTLEESKRARFAREGELTAALAHPGIVKIHGGGLRANRPFLVMELIEDARDLETALRALSRAGGLALLGRVANAVGAAHRQGVVHRDLKFENVLVDSHGQPKVCDFGLAWRADVETLTRTGSMLGTPLFMAPEQTGVGEHANTHAPHTDVWALGVMLYHLLSGGEFPFGGASILELIQSINCLDPFPLPKTKIKVSKALENVCRRSLAKSGSDRFPHAEAFAEALWAAASEGAGAGRERAVLLAVVLAALGVGFGLRGVPGGTPPGSPTSAPEASPSAPEASPSALDERAPLRAAKELLAIGASGSELFAQLELALRLAEGRPQLKADVEIEITRAGVERGHYERGLLGSAAIRDHERYGREARFLRGRLFTRLERHGEAISELGTLVDRNDRWGLLAQGDLALRQGRDLVPFTRDLRRRLPNSIYAAFLLNRVHIQAEDYASVQRVLDELKLERANIHLNIGIARCHMTLGTDIREARRLLERATKLADPQEPLTLNAAWSQLLLLEGNPQAALLYLRRRKARLTSPQPLFVLGIEFEKAGQLGEARESWRKSLSVGGPDHERFVRRLSMPVRLRVLRGMEVPLTRSLPKEAKGWIATQIAGIPKAARTTAQQLLTRCAKGHYWRDLAPDVELLRTRAPRSAAAALLEARLQFCRDRFTPAREALALARTLGADPDTVSLEEASLTIQESGLQSAVPALIPLARRDVPQGWVAKALLAVSRGDGPGALLLAKRAGAHERAPLAARVALLLALEASGRAREGVLASVPLLKETRFADRWLIAVQSRLMALVMSKLPTLNPQQLQAMFWNFELEMSLSDHPLPRLAAAEEALLLGPGHPWYASIPVWIQEANESKLPLKGPLRSHAAAKKRAVQGLYAMRRGAAADEVQRLWAGLTRGRHVPARAAKLFRERFGHEPRLAE